MRIIQAKLAGRRFGVKSKVIPQECSCKGAAKGLKRPFDLCPLCAWNEGEAAMHSPARPGGLATGEGSVTL